MGQKEIYTVTKYHIKYYFKWEFFHLTFTILRIKIVYEGWHRYIKIFLCIKPSLCLDYFFVNNKWWKYQTLRKHSNLTYVHLSQKKNRLWKPNISSWNLLPLRSMAIQVIHSHWLTVLIFKIEYYLQDTIRITYD